MSPITACSAMPITDATAIAETAVGTAALRSQRNKRTVPRSVPLLLLAGKTSLADYRLAPSTCLPPKGRYISTRQIGGIGNPASPSRVRFRLHHRYAIEIDVTDNAALEQASRWWEELTSKGGEGMVVKPLDFVARGPKGLVQLAIKCRGREY